MGPGSRPARDTPPTRASANRAHNRRDSGSSASLSEKSSRDGRLSSAGFAGASSGGRFGRGRSPPPSVLPVPAEEAQEVPSLAEPPPDRLPVAQHLGRQRDD